MKPIFPTELSGFHQKQYSYFSVYLQKLFNSFQTQDNFIECFENFYFKLIKKNAFFSSYKNPKNTQEFLNQLILTIHQDLKKIVPKQIESQEDLSTGFFPENSFQELSEISHCFTGKIKVTYFCKYCNVHKEFFKRFTFIKPGLIDDQVPSNSEPQTGFKKSIQNIFSKIFKQKLSLESILGNFFEQSRQ